MYLSHNARMSPHRDRRNALEFPIVARAVGNFKGGGLWLESEDGTVCRELPDGTKRAGLVHDLRNSSLEFSGNDWHASEDWIGDRWILSAFVPREFRCVLPEYRDRLRDLGFPVEGLQEFGEPGVLEKSTGTEAPEDRPESEAWAVVLPSPGVDAEDLPGLVYEHGSTARLCRLLIEEMLEWSGDKEGLSRVAGDLRECERYRDWLEQVLIEQRDPRDNLGSIRALSVDVPLVEPPCDGGEQFLQTRNVSLLEARGELGKWREPAREEVVSLEETNRAVDRVTVSEVDRWAREGVSVVQLPGKVVLTRKAGTGKRRCRAVCCGNYLPTEKLGLTREELYASGAESLSVKVAVTFAASHPSWVGVTLDVKSAFLYAPIRAEHQGTEERIVVKPPYFLVELGILGAEHRWWIRKALYGLPTSPRDWGRYRDGEFRNLSIECNGQSYRLVQLKADDALWLLRKETAEGLGDAEGILVVYVDDLALFAEPELARRFIAAVRTLWKTSEPEWITETAVTFCGLEISRSPAGYRLAQGAYIRELLNRYNIGEDSTVPLVKWQDPEVPLSVTPEEVKEAQAVTGALLWVSTRTRPDIAYVVSRCGQQATKVPQLSISLGIQTLKYLRSTLEFCIEVPFEIDGIFSKHGLLSVPRTERVIELYTDASHSPSGDRSMQAVIILWRGVPITWESSRQPFTTLSSAESELVCMVHGVQLCESIQPLVDELIEADSIVSLLADNEAAIRSFDTVSSGWRNRHLRMRAVAGRERVDSGLLRVSHLPGEYQVADLGTKPLSRSRIVYLLGLINIRESVSSENQRTSARALSRAAVGSPTADSARLLAGLALLAMIPRVKGQPDAFRAEEVLGWLHWVLAVVSTVACFLVGWFFFGRFWNTQQEGAWSPSGGSEPVESRVGELGAAFEVEEGSVVSRVEWDVQGTCESAEDGVSDAESSSQFSEEEWKAAQLKLEEAERSTGLTFVQRARLRRQLAAGEEVEVPAFLMRHGPAPAWFTGIESNEEGPNTAHEGGATSSEVGVTAVTLLTVVANHYGLFSQLLNLQDWNWFRVRRTARGFFRDEVLRFLESLWDTEAPGFAQGITQPQMFEFNESGWVPVSLGAPREEEVDPLRVPEIPEMPSDFHGQIGGSSVGPGSEGESPETHSDFDGQIGGSSVGPGVEGESPEMLSDFDGQIGGSSSGYLLEGVGSGTTGDRSRQARSDGLEISRTVLGARNRVRPGDSASSRDIVDFYPEEGTGGSSSSHGMQATPLPEPSYEDVTGLGLDLAVWPYVGTWIQTHFMVQLFHVAGEGVLWSLGPRSSSWFALRTVSNIIRYAMAGAIVDRLRRGPNALHFSSAQWFEAVEIFIREGYPPEEEAPGSRKRDDFTIFPYVLWAPGVYGHYLWRVFAIAGVELLSCLGSRDGGWGYLRSAAQGFRTHSVYAIILWLRATSVTRVTDGNQSFSAAETYIQTGTRVYPFFEHEGVEEREDDETLDELHYRRTGAAQPARGTQYGLAAGVLLEDSESSSSGDEGPSTTEPSVVSVGFEDSEQGLEPEAELAHPGGPAGSNYEARPGCLVVRYADDFLYVPLEGWSLEEVEEVVRGLETGMWAGLQARLEVGDLSQSSDGRPGSSNDPPPSDVSSFGFRGQGFRNLLWILLVWWCLTIGAEASCVGHEVGTWKGTKSSSIDALVCPAEKGGVTSKEIRSDGSTLWDCLQVVFLLGGWEMLRAVRRCCRRSGFSMIDRGSQTDGLYVPLPLELGVPYRDRVLFCLYRAGYPIDVSQYDEETQSGYYWLLGDYLERLERGSEVSLSD